MRGHLSGRELALASDGELKGARMGHLLRCPECRSRLNALDGGLSAFAEERRRVLAREAIPDPTESEMELARRLAQLNQESPVVHGWVLAGCAALLLAVSVWAIRPFESVSIRADVPDPNRTPGAVAAVDVERLCSREWSDAEVEQSVPRPVALAVFRSYGIADPEPGAFELDLVVPAELGGSVEPANLWPQPYDAAPWNAYAKDALEDHLRRRVCDGDIPLAVAQSELANDWTAAYRKYFGSDEPLSLHAGFLKDQPWE